MNVQAEGIAFRQEIGMRIVIAPAGLDKAELRLVLKEWNGSAEQIGLHLVVAVQIEDILGSNGIKMIGQVPGFESTSVGTCLVFDMNTTELLLRSTGVYNLGFGRSIGGIV